MHTLWLWISLLFFKLLLIVQKLLLHLILFQEIVQMADIVSSLFLASHVQNLHRIHELLPDTVQTLHGLLFRLFAPLRISCSSSVLRVNRRL